MTKVFEQIKDFNTFRADLIGSVGFIPSLGGLHAGHISLIKASLKTDKHTVVSLFLNPTQFNNPDDLQNYPSHWDDDFKILNDLNVSAVLKPTMKNIYPDDYSYKLIENKISNELCGAHRPGHFTGVLTIVMKLLNIVDADRAYFGEKDYQQLQLIKDMVSAFFMKTEIISCPIIREANGLALSSRNRLLSADELKIAPLLYENIKKDKPLNEIRESLTSKGFKIDYLEKKWGRIFVAAFLGEVRLIDNVVV